MGNIKYKDYFNIDPKYYAAVTADLIKTGQVKWDAFYPHETFVKLLEKVHFMLSGRDSRSLWVEGAYGTGKSHAALTVKSLLEASDEEVRNYFEEYGLSKDLCQKLVTDKNSGQILTIHRIGSAAIRSDRDLILAMQDSISSALEEHGISNKGEVSLKDSAIKWLEEKEANKKYFDSLIHEEKYMWDFGGKNVDEVIEALKATDNDESIYHMMRNVLKVAEDNGITALRLDVEGMCNWIKSIIDANDLSAIVFVWDEFTEYFTNNPSSLTGFQTIAEISESHPFYLLIVTHESGSLIADKDMRKKILNRFVGDVTVRIELPENMAFRLMAKAMKKTEDPVLLDEWNTYWNALNDDLIDVRNIITSHVEKTATLGQKTILSDEDLKSIVPIHPYAALLLKHMSVAFNSNARSMFDFIISNDMDDAKGFKWFISKYGPIDKENLLTIDMLWDFFTGKDLSGLNDDVRAILDSYSLIKQGSLMPDEMRVFKTILLLEAISLRVKDVDLLRPNEQNIDLAFNGTDWAKGKARSIAAGLKEKELVFERPVGNGIKEYTVANRDGDASKIKTLKEKNKAETKTQDLIVTADLLSAVSLPASIKARFIMEGASCATLLSTVNKQSNRLVNNRFSSAVAFALNDEELDKINNELRNCINNLPEQLMIIVSLVPMGNDLFTQFVENKSYYSYYLSNDKQRAASYQELVNNTLSEWKKRIADGPFMLYSKKQPNGIRVSNANQLQEELLKMDREIYYYGLENYSLIETMYSKGPLAQGAECGIKQEPKSQYKSTNQNTSLEKALEGAWKVEKYWEDPKKNSLPIVKIKQKVEQLIKEGLDSPEARVSIRTLFEALEEPPFGFMPNNVSSFVMGFILKEYVNSNYYWSNGSNSQPMTVDEMKSAIANAINQQSSPNSKYKEEYLVEMSPSQRAFLSATAEAFDIPKDKCGTIETTRDNVRKKMKDLVFPIWSLKTIVHDEKLRSDETKIKNIIDAYCGIANTANSGASSESFLADKIGAIVLECPSIVEDLKQLLTNEMCRKGMLSYIEQFRGGELKSLASSIKDNGLYLERVKEKFNADAANWVWSSVTADEKILDVIVEYRIIAETNKSIPGCKKITDVIEGWNKRVRNIRIPYDILKNQEKELEGFLKYLKTISETNQLPDVGKDDFYNKLVASRESFDMFYTNQFECFKTIANSFLDGLNDQESQDFFKTIPNGQFEKNGSTYYEYINEQVNLYKKKLKRNLLVSIWKEKTGTDSPKAWSEKYEVPILCMFDDNERGAANDIFEVFHKFGATDAEIASAITYLENAHFYDRLNDSAERDKCFIERVVGPYAVMLNSVEDIKKALVGSVNVEVYSWLDNSIVRNKLRNMADQKYKIKGYQKAQSIIDEMDEVNLRSYLKALIEDNLIVGMEIIKNQ